MADDIQSNIKINVDTASAMDSIRLLQNQISAFHTQMSKMGAAQAADARNLQQNLVNSINSTGAFTANMTKVKTTAEQFTTSLERNKLSMGEYFRYAGGASKTFGRAFKAEFETINKVARERVKDLQSQYIKLGRDANGAMQAIRVRPLVLDMDNLATRTQIAAQRQQLLNQLLKQGSTNLLNFGKNTQWAGRQLMVGFTIPLSIMGAAAMKSYKEIEEAGIRLRRVYGDFGTTNVETEKMVKDIQRLALEYTKYGVAVKDSMQMAADAAAMGKKGADLLAQVSSSARLAVLGGVDQQMALKTTTSLTDAFGVSTKQLAKDINFLNAVENQTVLSIEDMTIAIPKAAPVIQQLGGDVKDLAFFLTAMKEGGINASESANALKSGLASLINPTNTASKMLQGFGINLREIVQGNKGDVKKTVVDFAQALDTLDPLNRAKAIEQLFGKFQFARMSTLFKNVIEQGSQASQVLKLASASSLELSMLAQRELNKIEQSPLYKFQKSIADFQAALAPVGEQFMKALTPIINFGTDVLNNFNNLGEGVKGFIVKFVAVAGVVGPVLLMSFGLIANAVANVIKGFALMKDIFNKTGKSSLSLGEQVNYMTQEQIQAAAIASSLDQVHSKLKQTFTSEAAAVDALTAAYQRSVAAQRAFAVPITPRGPVRKLASGGFVTGPGTGTSDSIPAMLSNGEAVIPAKSVAQNRDLVQSLINDSLPRFAKGGIIGGPSESLMQQVKGTSAVIAYGAHQPFTTAHQGIAQMGMSMAEQSGMPFFQFTSNQGKAKRSLLSDDLKSRMISEAIGRNPEFAKNPFELMAMLSKAGIKDVNILLGEDRMKSPVWDLAAKEYGINLSKTGVPRPAGSPSGTMARAAAAAGNVGMFESLLASGVSKSTRAEVFKNLLAAATGKGKKFAFGGMVRGPGGPKDDLIPANLSNGEAVIDAETTRKNPRIISALFAGKKIVLPGYADNNSEAFDFEAYSRSERPYGFQMPARVTEGNAKKIREVLYAASQINEEVLDALKQSLENVPKMTSKNLDKVLTSPQFELLTSMTTTKANAANPEGRSTGSQGMVKAHATASRPVTLEEISPFMSSKNIDMLRNATKINALTNLTFPAPAPLNKENMITTGSDWASHIRNQYDDFMSQLAGQGLDTNDPAARAFADNVARKMEQAGAQAVGDSEFEQIVAKAISEEIDAVGKNVSQGVKRTFDEARKVGSIQYTLPNAPTERIAVDNKGITRSGMQSIAPDVPAYLNIPLLPGAHKRSDEELARRTAARVRELGVVSAETFQEATRGVLDRPENDPAIVSRDTRRRNSPHSQVSVDGKDDGVAYSQARTNAIAAEEAKAATKRSRRVTSEGPWITPGESQKQQVQRTRGGRVRTEGESFVPGSMIIVNPNDVAPTETAPTTIIPSQANQNYKRSAIPAPYDTANMSFIEKQGLNLKYGQGFQGKMFGASMGLGMASMFLPPELGQIAQAGAMASGVAGMFKSAGPKLGDALFKFGKPLIRLIPYVGAAVVAFEVFDKAIVPMIRKNADAYKAITDTLSITQEKLDKINSFFGTDAKLAGIRATVAVTGDQTKEQGTIAQQFQQTQEFKDLYQESAQRMGKLSDQEFKRAMEAYSVDLFGMGYEAEAVKAIIDAIAIEAKKTSVSIAPELFSLDDPKARQLMDKNINSIISDTNQQIKDLESQVKSTTGSKFTSEDLKKTLSGEYDNLSLFVSPEIVEKLKANTAQIGSYISALGAQFQNGTLSAKDFTIQYDKLIAITKTMPGNSGIEMLIESIRILNPELAKALDLINAISGNETGISLVIEATSLGVARNIQGELALGLTGEENAERVRATEKAYQDVIDKTKKNNDLIDAEEKKIKNVQKQSQGLANTEEKINEKYDKRIRQIEKIKKLNDQITKSQQGQLDLAQALSEGDVGAAAAAAIELQNTNVQNALDNQTQGLEDTRKAEIEPLKAAQDANTSAIETLTDGIEKLNQKTFELELPEGPELESITPEFGNDLAGRVGQFFKFFEEVSFGGALRNIIPLLQNPGKFIKEKQNSPAFLPPGQPKIVPKENANGGFIRGPGTGTSDDIPAMLSNGEYVIRANAVKTIGVDTLNKLNQADRLGFAAGGMVRKYKDGGIVESLFGNTQNWFNNVILSMFGSGGNPSAALNATAEDMTRTGIKEGQSFVKDYIFDPTNPVDIAMTAVPGLKPAKAVAKKAADSFGFPLVLKPKVPAPGLTKFTPMTSLGINPGGIKKIDGKEYYVKTPSGQPNLVGEMLGSTIWNKLGLGGPKLQMLSSSVVASKIIPNLLDSSEENMSWIINEAPDKVVAANKLLAGLKDYVKNQLPVNALLGNIDTHTSNILLDPKTGKLHNIDLGITNLSSYATSPYSSAKDVMNTELSERMRLITNAMEDSGFNAKQINDLLKKNGFSPLDDAKVPNFGFSMMLDRPASFKSFVDSRKKEKNFSKEIDSISKMLGFNLSKPLSHKTNAAAIDAKNNKLIQNMIKENPELEQWLGLSGGQAGSTNALTNWTVSQNLERMFKYLQNAAKDPIFKYANGGLVGYARGGMVGYNEGGYVGGRQVGETYRAYIQRQAAIQTAAIEKIKAKKKRDKLFKQGGFQGFEAGFGSFMEDLMGNPTSGGILKGVGDFTENLGPGINFALSTLSLPVNLLGGAVNASMNAGKSLAKGDLLGAATSGIRGVGDAFASTYGNMFSKMIGHDAVYRPQFEVAAQTAYGMNLFNAKNDPEAAALGRIIGGTGSVAFDPVSYTGLGLAAKASKLGTVAKNIKTSLGVRGAKNALKAAAVSTGADVSQVGKLTPTLAFNLSDEALAGVIKDNFYGNMRVPGMRSSTKDSLENRIAVEQSMMGISPTAPANKTPAYGFLTTREDVPSYWNSEMGGMGPRSAAQQAIDDFNLLINPNSRYTNFYGSNTIKLKPDALGRATVSMGDSLSIWDRATKLGQRIPGVNKLSSIFSTFPAMSGILGSTQKLLKTEIPGISSPTRFPYIEAHLPGGFTLDDIESIILNPSKRFSPQEAGKIAEDLAQRKAAVEAMLESMGIKGIKVTENEGIKIGDEALNALKAKTPEGQWVQPSTAEYPLPSLPSQVAAKTTSFSSILQNIFNNIKDKRAMENFAKTQDPQMSSILHSMIRNDSPLAAPLLSTFGRHRSAKPIDTNSLLHPTDVKIENDQMYGPGVYFAKTGQSSEELFKGAFGNNIYKVAQSPKNLLNQLLGREKYLNETNLLKEYENFIKANPEATGYKYDPLSAKIDLKEKVDGTMVNWNDPFIQYLNNKGYIGYSHRTAFTNWRVGVPGSGYGLKASKKKSIFEDLFTKNRLPKPEKPKKSNQDPRYQPEGWVTPPPVQGSTGGLLKDGKFYFANGGLVGGMMSIPEPAPRQFANGGMVRAATGGMLVNGKFLSGFANGGMVPAKFAMGGYAMGTDTVPAMLTPGEFVIKKSAVDRIGPSTLNKINRFAEGGLVGGMSTDTANSVYNNMYEINVNVSSNSNPDQIANAVMTKIRQIDNKRVRGSAF